LRDARPPTGVTSGSAGCPESFDPGSTWNLLGCSSIPGLDPEGGNERNVTVAPPGDQPPSQVEIAGLLSVAVARSLLGSLRASEARVEGVPMLDLIRRSHKYFVGGIVILLAGVFIAYLGLGGPGNRGGPAEGTVVQLGERRYHLADLQRVRDDQEQRLRDSLGDGFDSKAAAAYLDQISADQLVQRAVLASEAERIGLRASDAEVKALVQRVFKAQDGAFDGKAVRDYAVRRFGSEGRFVQEVRDDILFSKLLNLIDAGAAVSEAEALASLRSRLEEIRFSFVALDEKRPPVGVQADTEAVDKLLKEQPDRVRAAYDEQAARYHVPEKVHARHVLVRVEKDAPDDKVAEARQRIDAAAARIAKGEDFAKVAREVSEDPGSKDRGGDLGSFPRGQMVPAFEDVAFKQSDGQTSEVVRTDFGFHVIRTEAHEPAKDQPFEEVSHAIAEELANADRAKELARERSDKLVAAIRGGESLETAAREAGIEVKTTEWLQRRRDGYVPGLGSAPDVVTAAFAATVDKPSLDRVFDVQDKLVLIQLIERRGPSGEELAKQVGAERKKLLEARTNELRGEWMREARTRLAKEGRLVVDLSLLTPPPAEG
jgi:peptidyl-prolyl cis-trans isomerase D